MKYKIGIIFLAIALFPIANVEAYWIWTPKNKKWTNPKTAVKPTPQEQFDFALALYESGQYEDAERAFKKLLSHYPKAFEASEGQYYLGAIEYARGNLYAAYLAYQKVIDKYPFSKRIQEIIEQEYKIAEEFMSGAKRKALGMPLPVENPAIEIFNKVIENSTFGPLAPVAQYKLGLVLKGLARFGEAEEAFHKLLKNYPDSEWSGAAQFQIASCRAAVSRGPEYDQGAAKDAQKQFEDFIAEHPDAVLSRDAQEHIDQLKEKEAEAQYQTGRFYEKQNQLEAARIYYDDIVKNFPQSTWAAEAFERLRVLEKRQQ